MTTESVNDRQVGGRHYKSSFQHWDFVRYAGLDYFEGCATKYLTRRKENRLEDLKKAQHFLEKRISFAEIFEPERSSALCDEFATANKLSYMEYKIIKLIVRRKYSEALNTLTTLINAGGE